MSNPAPSGSSPSPARSPPMFDHAAGTSPPAAAGARNVSSPVNYNTHASPIGIGRPTSRADSGRATPSRLSPTTTFNGHHMATSPSLLASMASSSPSNPSFLSLNHEGHPSHHHQQPQQRHLGVHSGPTNFNHVSQHPHPHQYQRMPSPSPSHLSAGGHVEGLLQRPSSRNVSRSANNMSPFAMDALHSRPPGDTRTQLFVGNLPFRVRWQDLKDLFRKCGTVLRSDVALTLDNRSKGFGTVLFANEVDAARAIDMYNGYTWQSRVLDVRLDQQDPTGTISLANAAAQAAQQAAHQNHQQTMQSMASIMALTHGAGGHHPQAPMPPMGLTHMPNQAAASNPWVAAAVANANLAAAQAQAQAAAAAVAAAGYGMHHPHQHQIGAGSLRVPSSTASPHLQSLAGSMANLNLRRDSNSSQHTMFNTNRAASPAVSSPNPSLEYDPAGENVHAAGLQKQRLSLNRASGSPLVSGRAAGESSPSLSGSASADGHGPTISPTSARRPPPGSLGPMPPSIFANMSSSSHLPNPPAAAAAAVAAGYSIEDESQGTSSPSQAQQDQQPADNGEVGYSSADGDAVRRSSVTHQVSLRAQEPYQGQKVAAPVPLPGGLVNFYNQNGSNGNGGTMPLGFSNPAQMSPIGARNTPSPAYANRHLFVGNLPFNCQWQDLKDLFRQAGQILRADVSLGPDGRSRGFGTVLFATAEDAINAVNMFNGAEFQGRQLKVHFDKFVVGGHGPGGYGHQPGVPGPHSSPRVMPGILGGNGNAYPQYPYQYSPIMRGGDHGGMYPGDDSGSIPGTPIFESTLNSALGFPSPGFSSPMAMQQQLAMQNQHRQAQEQRRAGLNSEGVAIAPIGSEHHAHLQQHGPPPPLSPIAIPGRNGMPLPSPGGMFSPLSGVGPMSPQQGLPLLTPSMPGFSFHPFPQTPPLLPQFLSPGLGPFSPPLATGPTFFAPVASSGLRHAQSDYPMENDNTPLQSPAAISGDDAATVPAGTIAKAGTPTNQKTEEVGKETSHGTDVANETASRDRVQVDEDDGRKTPVPPTASGQSSTEAEPVDAKQHAQQESGSAAAGTTRRRSFNVAESATAGYLGVAAPESVARGVSMDSPRPNLSELRKESSSNIHNGSNNGSALVDSDPSTPDIVDVNKSSLSTTPVAETGIEMAEDSNTSNSNGKEKVGQTSNGKKSAWNLAWLKKS